VSRIIEMQSREYMALAAPAQAQTPTPTTSVAQADATLAKVATDRAAVNDEFAASERVCTAKFFVNNCLDKAKEKRRVELSALRALEVEAQHFKRADSVAKRDADLAERVRKDAEEQATRAAQVPKEHKAPDDKPRNPPSSGPSLAEREATHAAKLKREAAQEAADAGKRAANVEAFKEKQAESVRRQAEVARKKQENQAKAAASEASEKKRADAEAAAAAKAAKAASK
jgi:colicin import membrane protein